MRPTQRIAEKRAGGCTFPTILRSGGDWLRSSLHRTGSAESAGEHDNCSDKPTIKRGHGEPPYAASTDNSGEELFFARRPSYSKSPAPAACKAHSCLARKRIGFLSCREGKDSRRRRQ